MNVGDQTGSPAFAQRTQSAQMEPEDERETGSGDDALATADFSHIVDPRLLSLLHHWLDLRNGGPLPRRCTLDVIAMPSVLPIIWVCEYLPSEGTFRHRLGGEDANAIFGMSLRGKRLEEVLHPDRVGATRTLLCQVMNEKLIMHRVGLFYQRHGRMLFGERLMLPLKSDDGAGDLVVGATATKHLETTDDTNRQLNTVTTISIDSGERRVTELQVPVPVSR